MQLTDARSVGTTKLTRNGMGWKDAHLVRQQEDIAELMRLFMTATHYQVR